jgi:hypothetical protein
MTTNETMPLVRQVDHVLIECGDPSVLFAFFSKTLGLPVAWEMKDFGPMISGGIAVGNVNLEFIRFKTARFGHPIDSFQPRTGNKITGIAFEPEGTVEAALRSFAKREIKHGDAHRAPNWTDAVVTGLFDGTDVGFLAEYHFDVTAWRKTLREEIKRTEGGKLGVLGVKEIAIKIKPSSDCESLWRKFLSPIEENPPGCWTLAAGPRIRFTAGEENSISSVVLEVRSLPLAQAFLKEHEMLGLSSDERTLIQPTVLDGIQVFLSEV